MQELACYLKGLVTSQASNWMERVRQWVSKVRELCQRLAWSIECMRSSLARRMRAETASATESALRAVQKAMLLFNNLIHDEDLYGDDLHFAEKLHDGLEKAEAQLKELQRLGE